MNTDSIQEAAEKSWTDYAYNPGADGILYSSCYEDGFKAGAQWQKAQDEEKIKQLQSDYMAVQNELNVAQMKREESGNIEFKNVSDIENLLKEFYTKNKDGKGAGYGRRLIQQLIKEVADAQRKIYEFEQKGNNDGWISVKDRLPEDTRTLIISIGDLVTVGWYWKGECAGWKGDIIGEVTHWRNLPPAPKEQK